MKGTSFPLSYAQERLWFLDRLLSGNPLYNLNCDWRFTYPVDVDILQQSLNEMVRRHESLRTTFSLVDGEPIQIVAASLQLTLPVVDLRELLDTEREAEALRLATEEAQRPFDLEQGPLVRTTLLRIRDEEYIFLLTMHHIISDGWSLILFWDEFLAIWTAFDNGKPSPLSDLPIQYADFAVWQRNYLTGKVLETQLNYWKKQLANLSVLQLPTDHPRPPVQTAHGATHQVALSPWLSAALQTLSQQEDVTLFMTLLAAFQTLLFRYSRQDDIALGTFIANRNRAEIEGLIGFFVNTLVLRTDFSGKPSFRELLRQVRGTMLDAYAHQELPFAKLVQELQPERDLSRNPLFQVAFQLLNVPGLSRNDSESGPPGLGVQRRTAIFDLTFTMWESADSLGGEIEYNSDLFDADTIKRLAAHYETLLESIVADPDRCVHDLPLLSDAERQQLLIEWNATKTDYPHEESIISLFEAQVAHSPEATALVCEGQELTYQELNRRANQLARHLQGLGVGPEVLVGICMERSVAMVVGLLGILKAGGAYVPLDPMYPKKRLAFMLEDTQVPVLLTQGHLLSKLPEHRAQVVCLDRRWGIIAHESQENLTSEGTADNLAYVMYTSGSTGQPKGVCIPHRGVVRLVKRTKYVNLTAEEVFLQLAPLSFDASTFEMWGCLLNGAQLVIFPPYIPTLAELGQALRQYQVTTLWLTAGLFHQMVEDQLESLRHVRQLLVGGDVLSVSHVKEALQQLGGCQLINGYGPTESTTFTCCYLLRKDPSQVGRTVPIGRPIANTQVYILDRYGQLVPIGVPGELHIGGDGLARNYLNQPKLTAERFIHHPFSNEPGARLYKTGDLVRWRPDGNIEFLGRLDHQVKIRGFRIELGEIEAVLGQHPAVQQSVVLAWEDALAEKRLVAYVVPEWESAPTISELRRFLKEHLPDYMVPATFVMMELLPLTPSGKLDRHALPAPERFRPTMQESYMTPRTQTEVVIAEMLAELLGVDRVGVQDNFFELGGHSLLAIQLLSRMRETFRVELPVRVVFDRPTVAGLAESVQGALARGEKDEIPGVVRLSRDAHTTNVLPGGKLDPADLTKALHFESRG